MHSPHHTSHLLFGMALLLSISGCASQLNRPPQADSRDQVIATERAFAKSMADRDQKAFAEFISSEAIFYAGSKPLRGKHEITQAWAKFFAGPEAPFSWEPREVEVLESGTLAISSGPVRNGAGKLVANFTSIWRLEATGIWRIVFDKGSNVCDCLLP
ncbi:MAG: nuclear transport factor 2 family protein [Burkholderiales bacterium]